MARSTKITIETDSLLIFRARTSCRLWCAQCGEEVEMIAPEKPVSLSLVCCHTNGNKVLARAICIARARPAAQS